MTVWITSKNQTYLVDDPEDLTIEVGPDDNLIFDATNNEGVQIYKYTKEEEKK